jgi:thiamine-phosphate pyrophosphorylase
MPGNLPSALRLMLVTDDRLVAGRDLVALCGAAVRGGVTSIQLRLKEAAPRELAGLTRAVCRAVRVPVLVNDRADVALAAGAAGVHLGPDDVPVPLVRTIAPPGFLIGASVGTVEEVASGRGADYWGIGPWRPSDTKPDAGTALGPDGVVELVRRAEGKPCIVIGGVRPEDVPRIVQAGATGVAVVSGILGAEDVERAARSYGMHGRTDA